MYVLLDFRYGVARLRDVRVGYVVENPIWKTSYRLVLDQARRTSRTCRAGPWSRTPPTRTGRTSAWPWSAAGPSPSRWTCTSRCTSTRPVVEPELFASLRPVAYSGAMDDQDEDGDGTTAYGRATAEAEPPAMAAPRRGRAAATAEARQGHGGSRPKRYGGARERARRDAWTSAGSVRSRRRRRRSWATSSSTRSTSR